MLVIDKAQSKNWYLTLSEKVTIANPYFLFAFTHRTTNKQTVAILSDISIHPERYNEFAVVEGSSFTLDAGEFQYVVYAQVSSTNLSPTLADEEVESGILKVQFDVTRTSYEVTLNEKIYEIEQPTQILYLLLENGDFLLQESGDKIIL
jgi:UDP-N-acetylmuramyl tripeptide synthase